MPQVYNRRAYGCAVIKSINSNYNADFTHQPRTLPDGTVYATDKVLKYSVRNYLNSWFAEQRIFFFKKQNERLVPNTLLETYNLLFGSLPKIAKPVKTKVQESKETQGKPGSNASDVTPGEARRIVLSNLLSCLDIRLFGATFAPKVTEALGAKKKTVVDIGSDESGSEQKEESTGLNISIHGTVQITHGINRFAEGAIFSEQIMSPFRNPEAKSYNSTMSTLGTQVRLREGHYVHHFSVNPHNLTDHVQRAGGGATGLTTNDIEKLKEALRSGVTFYDSASKAGTENELLLWVELKEGSRLVLPSLVELVSVGLDREIDLTNVRALLAEPRVAEQVERIELYYHAAGTVVRNAPEGAQVLPL